ncbi:MAG: STAS domain-containing protein [Cyanobacterium sp. T60_A2020_053]|nr:STAS domain-containing protein [Cyanobacterium sp. T60_A2020_053]
MKKQVMYQPSGKIYAVNATSFQEDLIKLLQEDSCRMITIDFSLVEFLDSAGLMALVIAYKEAQKQGKKLSVVNVSPSVKIIFELSQLDQVLGIKEAEENHLLVV